MFLWITFSFCIWSKFRFRGKGPCLFGDGCNTLILNLLRVLLNSHTSWVLWTFVFMGHHDSYTQTRHRRTVSGHSHSSCLLCSYSCSTVPLGFTYKHKFKDKSTGISTWLHSTKYGALRGMDPCVTAWVAPIKVPAVGTRYRAGVLNPRAYMGGSGKAENLMWAEVLTFSLWTQHT